MFFYRGGRSHGNKAYFPRHSKDEELSAVLAAFIAQFYQSKPAPKQIVVNMPLEELELLQQALAEKEGRSVRILVPRRGKYKQAADFVEQNAKEALERHLAHSATRRSLRQGPWRIYSGWKIFPVVSKSMITAIFQVIKWSVR